MSCLVGSWVMKQLKVVHLVAGSLSGGAARGAYWLHKGLLAQGVDSIIITSSSMTLGEAQIISVAGGANKVLYKTHHQAEKDILAAYPDKKEGFFSTGYYGFDFSKIPSFQLADVIHLHWINDNFFELAQLKSLNKPIVWTLRDMWPMTGGCHYAIDCERFKADCGSCPLLGSKQQFDLATEIQRNKAALLPKNIHYIGISEWLSEQARQSSLLKNKRILTIANCIDTTEFFPLDKSIARSILGIQSSKKVLLIGATRIKDTYKGYDILRKVLLSLDKSKYFLVVFGASNDSDIRELGFEYQRLGYLYDTVSIRLVYSSADVFLCPSILEAFGKTVAESMACGTPVVCFDNSGPGEIVEHHITGYKAKSFDVADMVAGIEYVCFHSDSKGMSESATKRVIKLYDKDVAARQYIELYNSVKNDPIEVKDI